MIWNICVRGAGIRSQTVEGRGLDLPETTRVTVWTLPSGHSVPRQGISPEKMGSQLSERTMASPRITATPENIPQRRPTLVLIAKAITAEIDELT